MRITLLVLLIPVLWVVPAFPQTSLARPAASVLFSPSHPGPLRSISIEEPRDTLRPQVRPTYWKEGALIGGVLGALGGALLGHGLCEMSEESGKNCTGGLVLGGILGAAILAIPGALIGGQFPKQEKAEAGAGGEPR